MKEFEEWLKEKEPSYAEDLMMSERSFYRKIYDLEKRLEAKDDFAFAMNKRVEEKQEEYGDSWKAVDLAFLTNRVRRNYAEWWESVGSDNSIKKEVEKRKLVDLANLCRFLWKRLNEENKESS